MKIGKTGNRMREGRRGSNRMNREQGLIRRRCRTVKVERMVRGRRRSGERRRRRQGGPKRISTACPTLMSSSSVDLSTKSRFETSLSVMGIATNDDVKQILITAVLKFIGSGNVEGV